MAFTIDRVEAAKRLSISTRTVDRHIQAGRIRTKRIGKKMFLDDTDVEAVRLMDPARKEEDYVVIMDSSPSVSEPPQYGQSLSQVSEHHIMNEFSRFYTETQDLIAKKDTAIQDLSYRLGKAESELQNSVPMTEYKRATFLLESAKEKSDEDSHELTQKVSTLENEIMKRNSMILWLTILFILVLAFSVVFFLFTRGFRL